MAGSNGDERKVSFEEALNETGFGLYSYTHVAFTGAVIVAFGCVAFSSTIVIPASACELATTSSQQGIIAAAPIVGLLLGAAPWGYLGDKHGRRSTLMVSLVLSALLNLVTAISVNWIMLFVMQLVVTFCAAGQYPLAMTLLSESVPMAKRNVVVLLVASIFLLAQGIMAVVAIPIIPLSFSYLVPTLGIYWNSWRTLLVVYSLPSIITAACLLFMTESPKFVYFKRNEKDNALKILRTIHGRNHWRSRKEYQVRSLLVEGQKEAESPSSAKYQIAPLFRMPLLKYTIIMTTLFVFQQVGSMQIWLPTIANQFMTTVETGAPLNQTLCGILRSEITLSPVNNAVPCSLNNTAMLVVLAVGSLQSIVNGLVSTVVNITGRRNIVIAITALCGLSGVLVNLVADTVASAVLFAVMLLGFIVVGLYTAIAVAIFPTHLRALAVALTMSGGRIGTIASIQILKYLLVNYCDTAFYVFGSLFASSALVALLLPDDRLLERQRKQEKDDNDSTNL